MNREQKLFKNTILISIGNVGSKTINIILLPYYTMLLTTVEYGELDLINSTLALLIPIVSINMFEAVFRYSSEINANKTKIFTSAILTNTLILLIVGLVSVIISNSKYSSEYILPVFILLAINIIQMILKHFIKSINKMKTYVYSDFIQVIIFIIFNIYFIGILKLGVKGFILAKIFSLLIDATFILFHGKVYKYISISQFDAIAVREMFGFGIPLIPNSLMWWVNNLADRYLIVYFIGAAANGLYGIAAKFPIVIAILSGIFINAWKISAYEEYHQTDSAKFYSRIFTFYFFMLTFITSLMLIMLKPVIFLILGAEFHSAWMYSPLLIMAGLFSALAGFLGTNYDVMKNTKMTLKSTLVAAIVNISLNLIFIPQFGIQAASASTLISMLILTLIRAYESQKYMNMTFEVKKIILNLLILTIQVAIMYIIDNLLILTEVLLIFLVLILLINSKEVIIIFKKLFKKNVL
jgi:O-antigen/teichoic acid export membrane protein